MAKKKKEFPTSGAYEEMEKCKPKDTAVAAFKHRPYVKDWKEEDGNGKQTEEKNKISTKTV